MDLRDKVLKFIDEFTDKGRREQVIDCFMNGCCYWFACILYRRFGNFLSDRVLTEIYYAPAESHFACKVDDRVYDITGDVTDRYKWECWSMIQLYEPKMAANIAKACIDKEPVTFEEEPT